MFLKTFLQTFYTHFTKNYKHFTDIILKIGCMVSCVCNRLRKVLKDEFRFLGEPKNIMVANFRKKVAQWTKNVFFKDTATAIVIFSEPYVFCVFLRTPHCKHIHAVFILNYVRNSDTKITLK